jgi:hypothetical protein
MVSFERALISSAVRGDERKVSLPPLTCPLITTGASSYPSVCGQAP